MVAPAPQVNLGVQNVLEGLEMWGAKRTGHNHFGTALQRRRVGVVPRHFEGPLAARAVHAIGVTCDRLALSAVRAHRVVIAPALGEPHGVTRALDDGPTTG